MKKVFVLCLIMTMLSGCAYASTDAATPETQPSITETISPTISPIEATEEPEPSYVSKYAIEDFLLPVEEHSWEREFAPEFIMLHFSSAILTHPEKPFNIQFIQDSFLEYDVSTHYIIERDGTIRCYVPENRVAWHAGAGEWNNEERFTNKMNSYAIGVELVGIGSEEDMSQYMIAKEYRKLDDSLKGFTQEQYDALNLLIPDICERYNIPKDKEHIIGHDEYSSTKTDPGELFEWTQILN